jgi:hypothetical protein
VVHPLPLDAAPHDPDAAPEPDAGVPADAAPPDAAPPDAAPPDAAPDRCVYSYRFTDHLLPEPYTLPQISAGHVMITSYPNPALGGALMQNATGLAVHSGLNVAPDWIENGEQVTVEFGEEVPRLALFLAQRDGNDDGKKGEAFFTFWTTEALRDGYNLGGPELADDHDPRFVRHVELDAATMGVSGIKRIQLASYPVSDSDGFRVLGIAFEASNQSPDQPCPMAWYGDEGL